MVKQLRPQLRLTKLSLAAISLAFILAACGGSFQSWTKKTPIDSTSATVVTGVAASATKTAVPEQLTGSWSDTTGAVGFSVSPSGQVEIDDWHAYYARFSRVTAHRLSLSSTTSKGPPYGVLWSCSGTGRYRWTVVNHGDVIGEPGHELKLRKIHDACKDRVGRFVGHWYGP